MSDRLADTAMALRYAEPNCLRRNLAGQGEELKT